MDENYRLCEIQRKMIKNRKVYVDVIMI